jgi:hypothetical protein
MRARSAVSTEAEVPERLFHYKGFVEDHLVALPSNARVKLWRPDRFNDPWDCRVHYQIPTDPAGRKRLFDHLADMHRKLLPSIPKAHRALTGLQHFAGHAAKAEHR